MYIFQFIGIFGGIRSGQLGNVTFDNQRGQYPFKNGAIL